MPIFSDVKLTKEQAESVNYKGNDLLIRGVAGSGKSYVLMARAVNLYKEAEKNNQKARILILTYSKALVEYTKQMLKTQDINSENIVILNIDKLAWHCYHDMGHFNIDTASDPDRYNYVVKALTEHLNKNNIKKHRFYTFDPQFWVDEFDWIKQKSIKSKYDYVNAERSGRGSKKRFSRDDRMIAFDIFEIYSRMLRNDHKNTYEDFYEYIYNSRSSIPSSYKYDYVLIDEAQDLSFVQLRFATCITGTAITVAADVGQKIYKKSFAWKDIGIDIRGRASKKLSIPFRNTSEIWHLAESLQNVNRLNSENFSDMTDSAPPSISGVMPTVYKCPHSAAEDDLVSSLAAKLAATDGTTGILCRTYEVRNAIEKVLSGKVDYEVIDNKHSWDITKQGIKLCTMHSSKGLEFDNVIIPRFNQSVIPSLKGVDIQDDDELKEALVTERTLLYVAISRARNALVITYCGEPSQFLGEFNHEWYSYMDSESNPLEKPEFHGVTDEQIEQERIKGPKKEKAQSDMPNIDEGAAVYHKVFGEGIVSRIDTIQKFVCVNFSGVERNFILPDAFSKGFLSLEK